MPQGKSQATVAPSSCLNGASTAGATQPAARPFRVEVNFCKNLQCANYGAPFPMQKTPLPPSIGGPGRNSQCGYGGPICASTACQSARSPERLQRLDLVTTDDAEEVVAASVRIRGEEPLGDPLKQLDPHRAAHRRHR